MKGKNNGIPVAEFLSEMSEKSGLSVEICRRAINAQSECAIEQLKYGNSVHIPGLVTLNPYIAKRVTKGGVFKDTIQIKTNPSSIIENQLEHLDDFEKKEEPKETKGIRLRQIPSLM